MIGDRLVAARKQAGLTQVDLAVGMGDRYNGSMISQVEHGNRSLRLEGAVNAARELGVSLDYLVGLTDDPTPSARLSEAAHAIQRNGLSQPMTETMAAYDADPSDDRSPVEIMEFAPAAGAGSEVFDEMPVALLWFRNDWLRRHSIDPEQANVTGVSGDSMEPTLPDGCHILVDRKRREPRDGRVYLFQDQHRLLVKRAKQDEKKRWFFVSDNTKYPPMLLGRSMNIYGEVRWMARMI